MFKIRFSLSASNNFIFMAYYRWVWKPKSGSMEQLIDLYSKEKKETLNVIQIGANDGITHDPVHKFIKRDKWNAVLLEPQRFVFDQFLSKLYRKHANVLTLNAALGYEDGSLPIYKIGFSESRWATGLTTFDRATLEKAFTSGHVERKCKKEGIQIPEDTSSHIVEESVDVLSTSTVLHKGESVGIKDRIDLLMIDTEGFDFEVIKMFDIAKNAPQLIIFENTHLSDEDKKACTELLESNDYRVKKDGANTVALKCQHKAFDFYFTS